MGTITGLTAARMEEAEAEMIVDGAVVGDDLHLQRRDGTVINVGNVRGPAGEDGTGGGGGGGSAIDGSYEPENVANWPDPPPSTIQQALDMIAARVTDIERYNFVVVVDDGDPPPVWLREAPSTVVMVRPPE